MDAIRYNRRFDRHENELPCGGKCTEALISFTAHRKLKPKSFKDVLENIPQEDVGAVNENWFEDFTAACFASSKPSQYGTSLATSISPRTPKAIQGHLDTLTSRHDDMWMTPSLCGLHSSPGCLLEHRPGYKSNNKLMTSTPIVTNEHRDGADESFDFHLLSTQDLLCNESLLLGHGRVEMDGVNYDGVREKLGLNLEESNVSWTTSMATPPTYPNRDEKLKNYDEKVFNESGVELHMGAARTLFSPAAESSLRDLHRISMVDSRIEEQEIHTSGQITENECTTESQTDCVQVLPSKIAQDDQKSALSPSHAVDSIDWTVSVTSDGSLLKKPQHVTDKSRPHRIDEQCVKDDMNGIELPQERKERDSSLSHRDDWTKEEPGNPIRNAPYAKNQESAIGTAGAIDTENNSASFVVNEALSIFDSPPSSCSIIKKKAPTKRKAKSASKPCDIFVSQGLPNHGPENVGQVSNENVLCSLAEPRDAVLMKSSDSHKSSNLLGTTGTDTDVNDFLIKQCPSSCQVMEDPEIGFKSPNVSVTVNDNRNRCVLLRTPCHDSVTNTTCNRPSDDLFSQISPGSLNAICQAAESAKQEDVLKQNGGQDMNHEQCKATFTAPSRDRKGNSNSRQNNVVPQKTEKIGHDQNYSPQKKLVKRTNTSDELFSQASPGMLDALCEVSDLTEKTDGNFNLSTKSDSSPPCVANYTPVRWRKKPVLITSSYVQTSATTKLDSAVEDRIGRSGDPSEKNTPLYKHSETTVKTTLPSQDENQKKNTKPRSLFGRKTKRFSYPTSSQISKKSPSFIFNMKPASVDDKKTLIDTISGNTSNLTTSITHTPPGADGDNHNQTAKKSSSKRSSHGSYKRHDAEFTTLSSYKPTSGDGISISPTKLSPIKRLRYDTPDNENYDLTIGNIIDHKKSPVTNIPIFHRRQPKPPIHVETEQLPIRSNQQSEATDKNFKNLQLVDFNTSSRNCIEFEAVKNHIETKVNLLEQDSHILKSTHHSAKPQAQCTDKGMIPMNNSSTCAQNTSLPPFATDQHFSVSIHQDFPTEVIIKNSNNGMDSLDGVCSTESANDFSKSDDNGYDVGYTRKADKNVSHCVSDLHKDIPDSEWDSSFECEPNADFAGFRSASGKTILLSEKSVAKARVLLDDCSSNEITNNKQTVKNDTETASFETKKAGADVNLCENLSKARTQSVASESGKVVFLREASMSKTHTLIEGSMDSVHVPDDTAFFIKGNGSHDSFKKSQLMCQTKNAQIQTAFVGFQCASGKAIQLNETSLAKARTLLDESDDRKCQRNVCTTNKGVITSPRVQNKDTDCDKAMLPSCPRASDKTLSAQEQSFAKAVAHLDKIDIIYDCTKDVCDEQQKINDFPDRLDLVENNTSQAKNKEGEKVSTSVSCVRESTFQGFRCASGAKISLGEKSLQKAKVLMGDVLREGGAESMTPIHENEQEDLSLDRLNEIIGKVPMGMTNKSSTKDFSKLPKGFRPFKSPRIINVDKAKETVNTSNEVKMAPLKKNKTLDNICAEPQNKYEAIGKETTSSDYDQVLESVELDNASLDSFSNTQISEITKSIAAFLQMEDCNMHVSQFVNNSDALTGVGVQDVESLMDNTSIAMYPQTNSGQTCNKPVLEIEDQNTVSETECHDSSAEKQEASVKKGVTNALDTKIMLAAEFTSPEKLHKLRKGTWSKASLFQTAGGQSLTFSDNSLKKAKSLLSGDYGDECRTDAFPQQLQQHKRQEVDGSELETSFILEDVMDTCGVAELTDSWHGDLDHTNNVSIFDKDPVVLDALNSSNNNETDQMCDKDATEVEDKTLIEFVAREYTAACDKESPGVLLGRCGMIDENNLSKEVSDDDGVRQTITSKHQSAKGETPAFTTASGKEVNIFAKSLQKASKLINCKDVITKKETSKLKDFLSVYSSCENDTDLSKLCPEKIDREAKERLSNGHFVGSLAASSVDFQKPMTHAAKSLNDNSADERIIAKDGNECAKEFSPFFNSPGNKAKILNQCLHREILSEKSNIVMDNWIPFQTASGNKVTVSKKSLQHATNLLNNTPSKKGNVKDFSPFSTAAGNKVIVSKKSLEHATKFLHEETAFPKSELTFSPFSTAAGNKVKVSVKALQCASKLLEEDSEPKTAHTFSPFATASGNKVDVSIKAIQQVTQSASKEKSNAKKKKVPTATLG